MSAVDLAPILEETRSYLVARGDLDDGEPVPREELVEQAKANGYTDREVRESLRETDELVAGDDALETVRLATDTAEKAKTPETGERDTRGARSDVSDPQGETDETRPPLTEGVARVDETTFPPTAAQRDIWVNWILDADAGKLPVAPWKEGHAYPVEWRGDLEGDDRPETTFETARKWAEFDLSHTNISIPEFSLSDGLGTGILLPNDRPERERRLALIDWDDVRDPETEEIHPVAAEFINRYGGYVEVSRSGAGLHQLVLGGLRKRGKFIAPIDSEPFVGDDDPQVEIYDGGRHVAMTGRHVEGSGVDIIGGQQLIDEIITEYAEAEKDAGYRVYDPDSGSREGDSADGETDDNSEQFVPDPESGEYEGPPLEDLRSTQPDDRCLAYHAVVEAFYRGGGESDGFAGVLNWRLEGFAAAIGEADDLSPAEVKQDLDGAYLDDTPVEQQTRHETPARVDGSYRRAARESAAFGAPSHETLVEYGVLPPECVADSDDSEENESDRDLLELEVVVEPAEAMRAARAVEPADLDSDLPELERDDVDDVAIAVALADGLIDDAGTFPRDDGYTDSYYRARDVFGAPLPRYLDNSTLAERFDLISAAVARVGPEHILDELESEIITEDPSGEAIANIDPVWEETEGSGRIVAGYGAGFWCAEHDDVGSFSPLQVAALEHGIIDDEAAYPTGEGYKRAYRLLREEYGAPLPRWRATILEEVTVLPPAIRVRNDELSASPSAVDLEDAQERTEALVRDALSIRDRAQLVTVVPGGGKTYSTAIAADDEPVLYAPPRNELKQQMEEYAAEVSDSDTIDAEPSAYHLPILAERQLDDEAVEAGVGAVRDQGAGLLRDRDALLEAVEPHIDGSGDSEADGDDGSEDDDDIDLERAVCPTADGEHGEEWRVALQVARARGFDPAVLHQQARTLFGEELPCEHAGECEYTAGWDAARDPESCPDILIGSPGHAFVDSATSYYCEDADGYRTTEPRAVVIDEFPGDTYANEYGSRYMDHAVWLGEALVGVESREELLAAGLDSDTWVRKWISGDAADVVDAGEAIDALRAGSDIVGAVESAEQLLESEPTSDRFNITETLEAFVECDPESVSPDTVADVAGRAAELVREEADRAYTTDDSGAGELYDLVETLEEDIAAPLSSAAAELEHSSLSEAIDERTAGLPIAGDLRRLVDDAAAAAVGDAPPELLEAATEALRGGRDGCRALAVAAEDGYAHPDAWALLAGAIANPEETGVSLGSQRTLSFGEGEGMQHKSLTANGADIHADRDHHGAVVFDRPNFTSADGDKCALVGLDATARRDLWRIALGRDAEVRDIHDTVAERRRHIRDGMSHTVVQTANTPLPYHGDPSGRNFQEDLGVVEAAAEEYVGADGIDDKDPAVISTLKVLDYLSDELEGLADETVNYENMLGSDALGDHQVAVILGSQHFGDTEPERWAMYGCESADRGDTSGPTLDYDSDVANTYLKHMQEDATMQAILRAGRNDESSVVVAHTSALRDDVPVVAEGATVSAHSKGALAVADAAAGLNGRTFTAADVAERVASDDRGVGLRQVQNILADLRSSGYLQVEERGSRGRQYEYELEEDPGLADTELPDTAAVGGGSGANSKTKNELLDTYSWNFVLDTDADLGEGMLPPPRATIPASDTAATLADGVEPPS